MPLWQLNNPTPIGKIVKTNGYLGKFKVAFSFEGAEKFLKKGMFIFMNYQEKPVPFEIREIHFLSTDEANISINFIDDEKHAKQLVGNEIILPKKVIPGIYLNAHKDKDLTSFSLAIQGIEGVFPIIYHEETPNYPLIEIEIKQKHITIPLPEAFILKKDMKKRVIHVQLPEGLLEL